MTYLFLKTLHILAAALWVGGLAALLGLGLWLARHPRDALRPTLLQAGRSFGARVLIPAGVLSLLTGMGLAHLYGSGIEPWMVWGFVAVPSVAVLDAIPLQRTLRRLDDSLAGLRATGSQAPALLRRANALLAASLALLLSAVAVMVFKPML